MLLRHTLLLHSHTQGSSSTWKDFPKDRRSPHRVDAHRWNTDRPCYSYYLLAGLAGALAGLAGAEAAFLGAEAAFAGAGAAAPAKPARDRINFFIKLPLVKMRNTRGDKTGSECGIRTHGSSFLNLFLSRKVI